MFRNFWLMFYLFHAKVIILNCVSVVMNRQYGFIIGYRLEGKTPVERTRFNRRFLGYTDKSQYGKFSYSRDGLMSRIPNIHAFNSCFIIRMDDLEEVRDFCDQYHVELFIREVVLVESDIEALSI